MNDHGYHFYPLWELRVCNLFKVEQSAFSLFTHPDCFIETRVTCLLGAAFAPLVQERTGSANGADDRPTDLCEGRITLNSLNTTTIENQMLQARAEVAQQQFAQALRAIEDMLTADPSSREAMRMAVELGERVEQARLDEIERTQQAYSAHGGTNTGDEHSHLARARRRLREKQLDLALADVTLALLNNPADEDAQTLEKEIQGALLSAKKSVLSNFPTTLNAILLTARRYLEREKYELALEEVNTGLNMDISHPELLRLRNAIIQQREKRDSRRMQERRTALLLNIRELFAKTEFRQALDSIRRALEEFPHDTELKTLALEIEDAHAKWAEMKKFEENASEISARAKRARQLLHTDHLDEAIQEIAFGLLVDPQSPTLKKLETELWSALGQKEEERRQEEAQEAKKGELAKVTIHLVAAQEFSMYGQFGRALDEIANAYLIDPTNPEIKQLETSIRHQQLRSMTAPPLKLVYNSAATHTRTRKQNYS